MHTTFEAVIAAVAVIGLGLSLTRLLWPFSAAKDIGRVGSSWFDHEEDRGYDDRADGNEKDPPIPHRRLRPRG